MNLAESSIEHTILERINEHIAAGRWVEAEQLFLRALEDDPDSLFWLGHLAYFYYRRRRYTRCLEYLDRRNQLSPPDEGVCELLYHIDRARNDVDNAMLRLEQLKTIRALLPDEKRFLFKCRLKKILRSPFRRVLTWCKPAFLPWIRRYSFYLQIVGIELVERFFPSWIDPKLGEHPFRLSEFLRFLLRYDPIIEQEGLAYHKTREVILASRYVPYRDSQSMVLDIGTGKNSLPVWWTLAGAMVVSLDGSMYGMPALRTIHERCADSSRQVRFNAVVGDAVKLPFAGNSFDAVSAICMIEHIPGRG